MNTNAQSPCCGVQNESQNVSKQETVAPPGAERTKARKVYVPLVDIVETDQALLLVADMPGVDENGMDVTVEKNVLTIKGVVHEEMPDGYRLSYEEFGIGDYERAFTLPNEIDRDGITATIKDGILKVSLPVVKQAASRKVAVVAG